MTVVDNTLKIYEDFTGGKLNPEKWFILELPAGEDQIWRYAEPGTRITVADATVELDIPRFETYNDQVQIFDNGKQVYFSVADFKLPDQGDAVFQVEMAAENHAGNPDDYRDGFTAFNIVDLNNGAVFDFIATGKRLFALHERLGLPTVPPEEVYTHIIEAPLTSLTTEPGQFHEYKLVLNRATRSAKWFIDGVRVYYQDNVEIFPEVVKIGWGIFTLHPHRNGRSTALRGQGMRGQWRNFRYSI